MKLITRQKDWESLGVRKDNIQFKDLVDVTQVYDWYVEKLPNYDLEGKEIPGSYNLTRISKGTGEKSVLCPHIRKRYQVSQYHDFLEILKPLIEDGEIKVDTCALLDEGRKFFLFLYTGSGQTIVGGIKLNHYLTFVLSHGSKNLLRSTTVLSSSGNILGHSRQFPYENRLIRLSFPDFYNLKESCEASYLLFLVSAYKMQGFEEFVLTQEQVHNLLCRTLGFNEKEDPNDLPRLYHYFLSVYQLGKVPTEYYEESDYLDAPHTGLRFLNAIVEGVKTEKLSVLSNFNEFYFSGGLRKKAETHLINELKSSLPKLYEHLEKIEVLALS